MAIGCEFPPHKTYFGASRNSHRIAVMKAREIAKANLGQIVTTNYCHMMAQPPIPYLLPKTSVLLQVFPLQILAFSTWWFVWLWQEQSSPEWPETIVATCGSTVCNRRHPPALILVPKYGISPAVLFAGSTSFPTSCGTMHCILTCVCDAISSISPG